VLAFAFGGESAVRSRIDPRRQVGFCLPTAAILTLHLARRGQVTHWATRLRQTAVPASRHSGVLCTPRRRFFLERWAPSNCSGNEWGTAWGIHIGFNLFPQDFAKQEHPHRITPSPPCHLILGSIEFTSGLVIALIVTVNVDFPRIVPGYKNEVSRRQSEANWPPEGCDSQSSVICGNGISGKGILRPER
jgi:hypothetical protein